MRSSSLRISPVLALVLGMLLALTSCTTTPPATPTAEPPPPTVAGPSQSAEAQTPLAKTTAPSDTLRWSLEGISDLEVIDPARPGGLPSVTVIGFIFGGLVNMDGKMEVQPDGASDWSASDDGRVYTFTIRENLTFGDGTPVTAADWVYSINRALAPETASYGAPGQLRHIVGAADVIEGKTKEASGVKALDPQRLEIRLDEPLAYFLSQLVYPYTYVVPRSLVESGDDWVNRAYGTGPYIVEERTPGESIMLKANPHYWRGTVGTPKLQVIFNQDSETAYRRYRAGELDIMGSWQNPVPAAYLPEVQNLPDFQSAAILATRYIGFNNRIPPFDNVEMRRALAQAVDKRALVETVLKDAAIPADRILPAGLIGTHLPIQPLGFDPAAAKRSLEAAGYPNAAGLPEVTLTYAEEGDNRLVAQALQKMWQDNLGITVRLEQHDLDTFSKSLDNTYRNPETGLQMYYSIWGADYPDPHNFLSQQLRTDTANNNGHFSNDEFDRLVGEADRLGDREQIERRLQLYVQAEQIAIDRVGWLPLVYPRFNILLNPRVEGLVTTPNGLVAEDWTKVRLR